MALKGLAVVGTALAGADSSLFDHESLAAKKGWQ